MTRTTVHRMSLILMLAAFTCDFAALGEDLTTGRVLYEAGKYQSAFPLLVKAAENGDVRAMYSLGVLFLNGEAVAEDKKQARAWFEKAANLGSVDAQAQLGDLLAGDIFQGKSDEIGIDKALPWYLKAAAQGHASSQYKLSFLYQLRPRWDPKAALFWMEKAADQGHPDALDSLGIAYNVGRFGLAEDIVKAYMYFTLAFKNGFVLTDSGGRVLQRNMGDATRFMSRMTKAEIAEGDRLVKAWEHAHPRQGAQSIAGAAPVGERAPSTEAEAVIREIKEMVGTPEKMVPAFVVRQATPARIDRLFGAPEIVRQPTVIKENGLILAGRGTILSFEKPSDILRTISRWFPDEVSAAQAPNKRRFFGSLHLYGPYPNWHDEPAAFLSLWNCMPEIAWLSPAQSPFGRQLNDGGARFAGLSAKSSSHIDFGRCVREFWGVKIDWTASEKQSLFAAIEKKLTGKFAHFLSTRRCTGAGPDDCVLVLLLWSSLSPSDPALAAALQTLETDVAPAVPRPGLGPAKDQYAVGEQAGEPRPDEALRSAGFLRAKLASILGAASAWPQDSLVTTFQQITFITQKLKADIAQHAHVYQLENNAHANPWALFTAYMPGEARIQAAIASYLKTVSEDASCGELFQRALPDVQASYILDRLEGHQEVACNNYNFASLGDDPAEEDRIEHQRFVALLGDEKLGATHEAILSAMTNRGGNCFESAALTNSTTLREICAKWIAEPQAVRSRLRFSGLRLTRDQRFRKGSLRPLPAAIGEQQGDRQAEQGEWLVSVLESAKVDAPREIAEFRKLLSEHRVIIASAELWRHRKNPSGLIELRLEQSSPSNPWPLSSSRLLLTIGPKKFQPAGVPSRFAYQYDDGAISDVSDLDGDGNPEVWFSGVFGECDGADAKPGVNCAMPVSHMGEVFGNSLSYFTNDRKDAKVKGTPVNAVLQQAAAAAARKERGCATSVARFRAKLSAQGMTDYSLETLDINAPTFGKTIGRCHDGTRKIVYFKNARPDGIGLKYDGLYRETKSVKSPGRTSTYLRFYPDGTVLYVSISGEATPEKLASWFAKETYTSPQSSRGRFTRNENRLEFSISNSYSPPLRFVGLIEGNSLKTRSTIDGQPSAMTEEFVFLKFGHVPVLADPAQ